MTRREFEELAREALARLPAEFTRRIENVALMVKDEPDPGDLRGVSARTGTVYGLYCGTPLSERSLQSGPPVLPDRIILYRRALERDFPGRDELAGEIRRTVLHEVGHFFGLSERKLRKLGYG